MLIKLSIKGRFAERERACTLNHAVALVGNRMEMFREVRFPLTTFDPPIRLNSINYALWGAVRERVTIDDDWKARVGNVRCR